MTAMLRSSMKATATPMPMPTCDPVDETVLCVALVVDAGAEAVKVRIDSVATVGEAPGVLIGCVLDPAEGLAIVEVGERNAVVAEGNNERSCC